MWKRYKKNTEPLQQTDSVKCSMCCHRTACKIWLHQEEMKIIGMNWPLLWDSTAARTQTGLTWWRRWWWSLRRQRGRASVRNLKTPAYTVRVRLYWKNNPPRLYFCVLFHSNMSWTFFLQYKKRQKLKWKRYEVYLSVTFILSVVIGCGHH